METGLLATYRPRAVVQVSETLPNRLARVGANQPLGTSPRLVGKKPRASPPRLIRWAVERLLNADVEQRFGDESHPVEFLPLVVIARHGNGKRPRRNRGPTAVLAVFQHHDFTRRELEPRSRQAIDFRIGLAVSYILGRENELKMIRDLEPLDDVPRIVAGAARGDRFWKAVLREPVEQLVESRHRFEPNGNVFLDKRRGPFREIVERDVERMMVDHQLQRDQCRQTHHPMPQIVVVGMSPRFEQPVADFDVHFLGVDHQAVEIEHDGPKLFCIVIHVQWF